MNRAPDVSPQLQEWREVLDIAVVGSQTGWSTSPGVIWRGALHFTEHKVCSLLWG